MRIHIHIHPHAHAHMHSYTHAHAYAQAFLPSLGIPASLGLEGVALINVSLYICSSARVCVYVRTCVCLHVMICVAMYVCIHTCMSFHFNTSNADWVHRIMYTITIDITEPHLQLTYPPILLIFCIIVVCPKRRRSGQVFRWNKNALQSDRNGKFRQGSAHQEEGPQGVQGQLVE